MNALSAEYERQRRNNNMQAAANGLNTGAGSQMALAQSANYQANQAKLAQKENEALNDANRRLDDLKRNYQNAVAEATANNNYKLAAALMDVYQNAYNRQLQIENTNYTRAWNEDERAYSRNNDEASRRAQFGDFTGYASLYGEDIAKAMELTWILQNPELAIAVGKVTPEEYAALAGQSASTSGGSTSSSSSYRNASTSAKSGGGYSASRDRAYRGEPGYYNEDGQFVVPNGNGGLAAAYGAGANVNTSSTTPKSGGTAQAAYATGVAAAKSNGANSYTANQVGQAAVQTYKEKTGNSR
jgi:hypothetical protein